MYKHQVNLKASYTRHKYLVENETRVKYLVTYNDIQEIKV